MGSKSSRSFTLEQRCRDGMNSGLSRCYIEYLEHGQNWGGFFFFFLVSASSLIVVLIRGFGSCFLFFPRVGSVAQSSGHKVSLE